MLRAKQELRQANQEVEQADALVVLACGAGIQAVADMVPQPVLPEDAVPRTGRLANCQPVEQRASATVNH